MEITKEIIKNEELFSNIDTMIKETLEVKSIKELQDELVAEINENRGKYKDNFNPALIFGEKGQDIFRKFLEEKRGFIFISDCQDNSSDQTYLKNGKINLFELKTDSAHMKKDKKTYEIRDTKNIVIEFESRGKPSGLSVTKAEYFVTYFPQINELWLIKTEKLKMLIREEKYDFPIREVGDDGSHTMVYLPNRIEMKSEFSVTNVY